MLEKNVRTKESYDSLNEMMSIIIESTKKNC